MCKWHNMIGTLSVILSLTNPITLSAEEEVIASTVEQMEEPSLDQQEAPLEELVLVEQEELEAEELVAIGETAPQKVPEAPKIDVQRLSEALGHFIGRNLNPPGIHFDVDSVIKGIRAGSAGDPAPMSEEEYELTLALIQEAAFREIAQQNLESANTFLETNERNPHIIVLDEGKLQYEILAKGQGPAVEQHGKPLIHYTGRFADGTVFGTSEEVGSAVPVPLDQTIPGFSQGVVGMKEGEKRRLYVHPELGYGTTGQLPPNSLLIFDIEIVKADSAKTASIAVVEEVIEEDSEEEKETKGDSIAIHNDPSTESQSLSLAQDEGVEE